MHGSDEKYIQNFSQKSDGKKPHMRPRNEWEDSTELNVKGGGCDSADWIHLAQDKVQWQAPMNMVMNLQVL
jgi:hypothetical protein